jgi:hypothetical protein
MGNYRCHFPCAVNNTAQHRMSCALTLTITIEPGATCCSVIETVNGYNIPSTMSGADENTDLSTLFSCKLFNMTRSRAEGSGRNTTSIRLASGLGHQVRLLGCACGNKQPCGESSATCGIVTRVCSSRKPSPCQGRQMAGQQERTTDVPGLPLADNTHVTLAHPCRSAPPIDRVDATHRLSLSSGLPFRPAFQPSSPSVGLTPAGRLPFSYTRYFLPHCCPLSLAFLILLRPGPDRQRRPTRA